MIPTTRNTVTRFRRTTWLIAFMALFFSMFGGPAALLCVGCESAEIELGSCCCSGSDDCEPEPAHEGHDPRESRDGDKSCEGCVDFVFRMEAAPVEKVSIDPAPETVVFELSVLHFACGSIADSFRDRVGRPPDMDLPLRILRTVRLLI